MRYRFDLKRNFYQVGITTAPPFILISVCHSLKLLQANVTEKGGVVIWNTHHVCTVFVMSDLLYRQGFSKANRQRAEPCEHQQTGRNCLSCRTATGKTSTLHIHPLSANFLEPWSCCCQNVTFSISRGRYVVSDPKLETNR